MALDRPESPIEHAANQRGIRLPVVCRLPLRLGLVWMITGALVFLAIGPISHHGTTEVTAATGQSAGSAGPGASGTGSVGSQGRQLSLAERLRVGLKAKTAQDKAFIHKVVEAVDQGKLPRRIVDSTFLWARKRAERKSKRRQLRPMVYFWPALQIRAKKLGISLPEAPWQPVSSVSLVTSG